jgi:flagellar biosynthesis protein
MHPSNDGDPVASVRRKVAVALRYHRETDSAPQVVAGGYGAIADRILELAASAKVPVHEDAVLADALGRIGVDRPIPPELYQAVAEVISFVYRLHPRMAPT